MPKKILVVEDHTDTREMLEILLMREGYQVITAADGVEGLVRAKEEHPDLILTDLHMPNLDGIEMVEQLRQLPQFDQTEIIAMTADRDLHTAAIQAGVDRFLKKPFVYDNLVNILG